MSSGSNETNFCFPRAPARPHRHGSEDMDALTAIAGRARGQVLLQEKEIVATPVMLAQEFKHRLINGLQLIVSLLSLQSRTRRHPKRPIN